VGITNRDVVAENMTSVETSRVMEDLASGKSRVRRSNREAKKAAVARSRSRTSAEASPTKLSLKSLEPMYASVGREVPEVRVELIDTDGGEKQRRIIGGDLLTLLYTIQLGAVSVDPWHSRVQSLEYADYTIIDLDPGPRANFARVIQVARWAKEVIDGFGLNAAVETSGSTGLHLYLPLPPRAPNEAATLVAQMIATKVASAHHKEATIERFVKARGAAMVYVDYLQNIQGKTVASAYSVRAKPGATVSTPLEWNEITDGLDPRVFHLGNAAERFEKIGDIWGEAMRKKNSLRALV
jgi:bifunctional non-homologous end joining protein LigD